MRTVLIIGFVWIGVDALLVAALYQHGRNKTARARYIADEVADFAAELEPFTMRGEPR